MRGAACLAQYVAQLPDQSTVCVVDADQLDGRSPAVVCKLLGLLGPIRHHPSVDDSCSPARHVR